MGDDGLFSYLLFLVALSNVAVTAQKHLTLCANYTAPVQDNSTFINAAITYDLEGTQVWISDNYIYPFNVNADQGNCHINIAHGGPFVIPEKWRFQVVYGVGGWGGMTMIGVTVNDATTLYEIAPLKWVVQNQVPLLVPSDTVWTRIDTSDDESIKTNMYLFSKDYLAALGAPEGGKLSLLNVVNLTQFNNEKYPITGCSGGAYVRGSYTIFIMRTGPDSTSPGQMITFQVSQQDGSVLENTAKIAYLGSEPQVSTAVALPNGNDVAIVWGQPVDTDLGSVFSWSVKTSNLYWNDVPFSSTEAWTAITPVANAVGEFVIVASDSSAGSFAVCTYASTKAGLNFTSVCATQSFAIAPQVAIAFDWEGDEGKVATIGTTIGNVNQILMYKWGFPGPSSSDSPSIPHRTASLPSSLSRARVPSIPSLFNSTPAVCMPACTCAANPQICGPTLSCPQSTCDCQQDKKRRIFDCCP